MGETALEVNHVSIDYKNLMHMSMHQALLKKDVKRADIVRAVDDVSFSVEREKFLVLSEGMDLERQHFFDLLLESSDQMKDGLIQRETVFL